MTKESYGPIGPFLTQLSAYEPRRNKHDWRISSSIQPKAILPEERETKRILELVPQPEESKP